MIIGHKLRNRHFFILDAIFMFLTPFIVLSLRINTPWSLSYLPGIVLYALVSTGIKLAAFSVTGLYRRYWPFASLDAMLKIIISVGISSLLNTGMFIIFGGFGLPRSIPLIDAMATLILIGGSRFTIRVSYHYRAKRKNSQITKRVLIAGAGEAGQMVAREMITSKFISYDLIGYVDDDPMKIGSNIHTAKVLGPLKSISIQVEEHGIQEVIIAMPTTPGEVIREVVKACNSVDVQFRILPGIYEMLSGRVSFNRLRKVRIDDLLRRDPVSVDPTRVKNLLSGKVIMVTGAGGSIGSELCIQIASSNPSHLLALGHGENSLHTLRSKFRAFELNGCRIDYVVADLRDKPRLQTIFSRYQPQIVFHAAAHKHVPLMEANIEDAVTNNIQGTWTLVDLAKSYNSERLVLISTDKAVEPVSVMGMTKRVAEMIVQLFAQKTGLPYVSVRFGNVLGSRGSVIPLFTKQIENGGPITITHPDMERFFMTIPEAVQLVLQASALGSNGEVFLLDMGEPIKISDLAQDMIELSGYEVDEDIKIEYTGLRVGERLFELLASDDENFFPTEQDKILVTHPQTIPHPQGFKSEIDALIELTQEGNSEKTLHKLKELAYYPKTTNNLPPDDSQEITDEQT